MITFFLSSFEFSTVFSVAKRLTEIQFDVRPTKDVIKLITIAPVSEGAGVSGGLDLTPC